MYTTSCPKRFRHLRNYFKKLVIRRQGLLDRWCLQEIPDSDAGFLTTMICSVVQTCMEKISERLNVRQKMYLHRFKTGLKNGIRIQSSLRLSIFMILIVLTPLRANSLLQRMT